MNTLFQLLSGEQIKHVKTILNWQSYSLHTEKLKIWNDRPTTKKLFTISAKNMHTCLSEYDWNLGKKKTLLDSAIKSSLLESVVELIIECEETFEYNSYRLSRSE